MKKYLALLLSGAMMFSAAGCGGAASELGESSSELHILMRDNYISDEVITDFEEKNNCTVHLTYMDDRGQSYEKLQQRCGDEYDLVMTSSKYMAPLIDDKDIEKIEKSNVPNSSCINESYWLSKSYSIPYLMQYLYVVYDPETCPVVIDDYHDLLAPELKGQIAAPEGADQIFPIALLALGYDPNSTEEEEIAQAYDWLMQFDENVAVYGNDVSQALADGTVSAAITYDFVAADAMAKNSSLIVAPFKDKVLLDTDLFVIPKDARHVDLAEKFLNHICDPEVMAKNLEVCDYSCPNDAAVALASDGYQKEPARKFEYREKVFFRKDVSKAETVYDAYYQQLMAE